MIENSSVVTRNVQQIPSTKSFTLTLPKEWCDEYNLKKKDPLELTLNAMGPATILIAIPSSPLNNSTEVELQYSEYKEITGLSRAILRRYLEGFEVIKIHKIPAEGKERIVIEDLVDNMIHKLDGCSIEKRRSKLILQINSSIRSPRNLLQQLFELTKEMFTRSIDILMDFSEVNAEIVKRRENEADKLYFAIVRNLKQMLKNPYAINLEENFALVDTLEFRMIASNLENLADNVESIADALLSGHQQTTDQRDISHEITDLDLKELHNTDFEKIANSLNEGLGQAFYCFMENDERLAITLADSRPKIQKDLFMLKNSSIHPLIISLIEEAIECLIDILELVAE